MTVSTFSQGWDWSFCLPAVSSEEMSKTESKKGELEGVISRLIRWDLGGSYAKELVHILVCWFHLGSSCWILVPLLFQPLDFGSTLILCRFYVVSMWVPFEFWFDFRSISATATATATAVVAVAVAGREILSPWNGTRKTSFWNGLGHNGSKVSGACAETESFDADFSRSKPALMSKLMRVARWRDRAFVKILDSPDLNLQRPQV